MLLYHWCISCLYNSWMDPFIILHIYCNHSDTIQIATQSHSVGCLYNYAPSRVPLTDSQVIEVHETSQHPYFDMLRSTTV